MNRITRMLMISGLGLFAGVTIGAGPAMAASNTGQGATQSAASQAQAPTGNRVDHRHFDSRRECELAGRTGERFGRWDDYDCYRSHGDWVLDTSWNNDDNWHHGGHWNHGGFPGGPFHPFPAVGN